VDPEF
jgi:hypothetical protein